MSYTIAAVTNTTPWATVITQLNSALNIMSTQVVSANSATAFTTGNGFVTGVFGATTLVSNTIQGGTIGTPATLYVNSAIVFNSGTTLSVGANVVVNTGVLFVGNTTVNAAINSSSLALSGYTLTSTIISTISGLAAVNVNTTGTTSQIVDFFPYASYRSAEYTLQIKDLVGGANSYQISKVLVVWDGSATVAYSSEYGICQSNSTYGSMGAYTAAANATHVILSFTPTSTSTNVKGVRSTIAV